MTDSGFIFALVVGAAVLALLLTVSHIAASRLAHRKKSEQLLAPEVGSMGMMEPELDLSDPATGMNPKAAVKVRRASFHMREEPHGANF